MANNKLVIAERGVGKTTYLLNKFTTAISCGKQIVVMDSATEHPEKSLLEKVKNLYSIVRLDLRDGANISAAIKENANAPIIGFDLSYFLEKGHQCGDVGDLTGYEENRKKYRDISQKIVSTLIELNNEKTLKNVFVIMDEIELPILNYDPTKLQGNDISFVAAIHPENSFGTFYKGFEKANFKPYNQLCGSACLQYIFDKENIKCDVSNDLTWIFEIGTFLRNKTNFDVEIYYYKSKSNEFYQKSSSYKPKVKITEKKFNVKTLKDEVMNNKYVIINVNSAKFNKDRTMIGGHFVVLTGIEKGRVAVINPRKNDFELLQLKPKQIIKFTKDFGNWRLLIEKTVAKAF